MKKAKTMQVKRQRGFTLIEMMVTISIVAILAAIAAPNMQAYVRNNRITGASQELLRSLQAARSEATKRQSNVVVCASANPTAGTAAACATSGLTGWFMFQDTNADGTHDTTEEVIDAHTVDTSKLTVRSNGAVTYLATGFSNPGSATAVVICDSRGNADGNGGTSGPSIARGIDITGTGRARITRSISEISGLLTDIGAGTTCP